MPRSFTSTGSQQPYWSVVATSRNDDHGGDLLARTQAFVDVLGDLCNKHQLATELLLVEWNPPPDRPSLATALRWPDGSFFGGRVVQVPTEVHQKIPHAEQLPLFQMIGKNVGIRRARGRFVLSTNIDLILSDELVAHIAQRQLNCGQYYRVDRWDVPSDVVKTSKTAARLGRCAERVLRVHTRYGTIDPACAWQHRLLLGDNCVGKQVTLSRLIQQIEIAISRTVKAAFRRFWRRQFIPFGFPHTNACGDFTLMARDDWQRIRGYAEFPMYSWHLDSLMIYCARQAGITEQMLREPLYHIEHGGGWTPAGGSNLWSRLDRRGIPYLRTDDLYSYIARMRSGEISHLLNNGDWGLGQLELPELLVNTTSDRRGPNQQNLRECG